MLELARIFLEVLGPVVLIVAGGFIAGRRLDLEAATLAKLAYWILGPVFIYDILANAEMSAGLVARLVGATLATMAVTGGLVALGGRLAGRPFSVVSAGLLTSVYGNVGNFGLAIVVFSFGESALPVAGVVLLAVNGVGLIVGVTAAGAQTLSPLAAVRRALLAPMTLAVIPAVVVNTGDVTLPIWLERPISLVAGALIPVVLLTLGVQLAGMRRPRVGRDVMAPVAGKLVVSPLVATGAVTVLGLTGTAAGVLVLQLAMPAAVFAALIAIEHDHEADLVTTTVMVGTILSVVTLPVVISLVT